MGHRRTAWNSRLSVGSEPKHAGYGAAVASSRANASGMVSQPSSKVSGLLSGLGLGGFIDGHCASPDPSVAPHGQRREPLPGDHHCRVGSQHADRRLLSFGDLVTCPGRFHRRDHGLAAGTPRTELELPFRTRPHRLGHLQCRGGLIDHEILGVHHVRDDLGGPLSWDIGFLIFGVCSLSAVGYSTRRDSARLNVGPSPPGNTTSSSHRDHARPYGRGPGLGESPLLTRPAAARFAPCMPSTTPSMAMNTLPGRSCGARLDAGGHRNTRRT
jgi:Predicted membrane protein (DUF2243)